MALQPCSLTAVVSLLGVAMGLIHPLFIAMTMADAFAYVGDSQHKTRGMRMTISFAALSNFKVRVPLPVGVSGSAAPPDPAKIQTHSMNVLLMVVSLSLRLRLTLS